MFLEQKILQLEGKNVMGRVKFNPPFKINDTFEDEARFVHFVHGNSKLHLPDQTVHLQSSESFVMRPESFVNNHLENENGEPTEIIAFQIYPSTLKYIYDDQIPDFLSNKPDVIPNTIEKIELNSMLANYIDSIRHYFDQPELINEELVKLKIRELILVLINSDQTGEVTAMIGDLFGSQEYEFKEIIRANIFEDLNLDELAHIAGMSLSSFKRKFKSIYNTSPNQYFKSKRLEKASRLLKSTDERISDIAYDCGFNDLAYFSKAFHVEFDCAPSEYRKKHLN